MINIVFLDRKTIGPTVKISRPKTPHNWIEYDTTTPTETLERVKDADIIISNKVHLTEKILSKLPKLKMISISATGYNIVDIQASSKRKIIVSNVRNYAIKTVPEHTFALIFALRRNIIPYRQDVINGEWQRSKQFCFFNHPIKDLSSAQIGIIGKGSIGESVASIARSLGMNVVFAARKNAIKIPASYTPFDEVIKTSDVITLHTPLFETTHNIIAKAEFDIMEKKPLLINTSRGGLVDEIAMVNALNRKQISGIGFDVLTSEPPKSDNPILSILDRPNVIITPHIAWASEDAMQTLWDQTIQNIDNFLSGNPSNILY